MFLAGMFFLRETKLLHFLLDVWRKQHAVTQGHLLYIKLFILHWMI